MGLSSLCNFTVGFMLMYLHLLFVFITLLHLFVLLRIFVMSCGIARVLPLSASAVISSFWFILCFKLLIVFHSRCSRLDRIVWCCGCYQLPANW
jgi:hypothetical protein